MAKVRLEKTIYKGFEGDVLKVKAIATELTQASIPSLGDCSVRILPSSFFGDNKLTPSEDVDAKHQINWNEATDGTSEGIANILLKEDDVAEGEEGALLYIYSKNQKKIKPANPIYAILIISDAPNEARQHFEIAENQLLLPPEQRSHYGFQDFVVNINRSGFVNRPGWKEFLASPIDVWHKNGTRSISGFFTDVFDHEDVLYAIAIYKPHKNGGGLAHDRCRKSIVDPNKSTRIYWEPVTEEELLTVAEASGYKNWGEFGNVFGGTRNERRVIPDSRSFSQRRLEHLKAKAPRTNA